MWGEVWSETDADTVPDQRSQATPQAGEPLAEIGRLLGRNLLRSKPSPHLRTPVCLIE
jgi:hypothetical protein